MPYYRLFYHIVWATKRRLPLITSVNRDPLMGAIAAKTERLRGIVHALNSMEDHVHLVVTIPPTLAIANFVGQIKGNASFVASHLPDPDPSFEWQAEYGVTSVSESHLPTVIEYVRLQQKHHAEKTLRPVLEL